MFLKNLDLFSTQFQFNVEQKQVSKRSIIGGVLSLVIICLSLTYFIYLLLLYVGNQIDPKYKSQTFITDESIKVNYHNNIVGFRYEYQTNKSVEELEKETGLKYLVYISFLEIQTPQDKQRIQLDTIQCQEESLQGHTCVDFSKVPNETLENYNSKNIFKQLMILVYRCTETDYFKKSVPNNCANDQDIENVFKGVDAKLKVKLYTSQYNTISEQIQKSYMNIVLFMDYHEMLLARFKAILQTTEIKQGPFIQSKTEFSSPIDYLVDQRVFNRQHNIDQNGMAFQFFMIVQVAEQHQQIQIQYATFMEILAICNSAFTLLMGVGIIGRYFAKQLIKEDIQILLLQNVFQQQYLKYLKKFNIFQNKIQEQPDQERNLEKQEDVIENTQQVFIPSFLAKSKELVGINILSQQDYPSDFIMEQSKDQQQINKCGRDNITCESELSSYRSKFNIAVGNNNILNNVQGNQQSLNKDKLSRQKESYQKILQKKKSQQEIQLQSQNSKELSDRSRYRANYYQIKYETNRKISNSNNNLQMESALSENSSLQLNNSNREYISQQNIAKKCIENLKVLQSIQIGSRAKDLIFKPKLFKKNDQKLDPIFMENLDKEVNDILDIVKLYKEMINLKKAVMMILSKEQYAAIQLIGVSDKYSLLKSNYDDKNTEINEQQSTRMHLGHLDEQFMISNSFQRQAYYINAFLNKYQNDQDTNEIDQRIYSSLAHS